MTLLVEPFTEAKSVFYRAFVRDRGTCVYCGLYLLQSFDAFVASHLDHLKPASKGGSDDDVCNRVLACGVCNSLKGPFDPTDGITATESTFAECIQRARLYISEKRKGLRTTSYWTDYQYWLEEMKRLSEPEASAPASERR